MPKPNQNKHNENTNRSNFDGFASEKMLLETKPSFWLYSDNFILKIIVLFLLAFLFAPIMAIVYSIHSQLVTNFHMAIDNIMFYTELIIILLMLVVIIKLILDILDWNYTRYIFTDARIIIQRGFIHKDKIMMSYNKIQDIEIRQSLIERILGVGDIIIYGANETSETILDDIPSPKNVEEIILTNLNNIGFVNQNTYMNNQYPPNQYQQQPNYSQQYSKQYQENISPKQNLDNYQYDYNGEYVQQEQNNDGHYFNNSYDDVITPEKPVREKWNNNKEKKSAKTLDKDEILKKHDDMFKRHNK